jgi:hypothetical protein
MPQSASSHRRKLLWMLGVLALVLLALATDMLLARLADTTALAGAAGHAGMVTTVVLFSAAAFLIDQVLRIFIWDGAYTRLTGSSAPGVIQGAGSAVIYTITLPVVLSGIVKLDTGAGGVFLRSRPAWPARETPMNRRFPRGPPAAGR